MTSGSGQLRELYLDPVGAGVPWLLDPERPQVVAALRAAATRTGDDPCDVDALVADLPDLLVLLRERHFGLATGAVSDPGLDAWAQSWRARLTRERPATWGAGLGTAFHDLRQAVGDLHLTAVGESIDLLRAVYPRRDEPVYGLDPGPPIEEQVVGGVLTLRVRSFVPTGDGEQALVRWRDGHQRHFRYDRIIVDVRGNGGGGSTYARDWITDHVPEPFSFVAGRRWLLDGEPLIIWNYGVTIDSVHGRQAVPREFIDRWPSPGPDSALTVDTEQWRFARGNTPWHGRMLVLTDRRTASAGEGVAWLLRQAFDTRIVGGRSAGMVTFGDIVPYLLPRSGLQVTLASRHDDFGDVEMAGLPVDVPLDPRTPLAEIAADVDRLHEGRS